jgi:hypothetical protein
VQVLQGAASGHSLGAGTLLDVSLTGGFLRLSAEMKPATAYRLKIAGPDGAFELPCRVVRVGPRGAPEEPGARHYGLAFNPTADQERRLRDAVEIVRRAPSVNETPLDRTLRDYWSS